MEAIYVIQKSLEENFKMQYDSYAASYAATEEEANEILQKSLNLLERIYPDLKVLGHDKNWLHITYTDLETENHMRAIYSVRKVCKSYVL